MVNQFSKLSKSDRERVRYLIALDSVISGYPPGRHSLKPVLETCIRNALSAPFPGYTVEPLDAKDKTVRIPLGKDLALVAARWGVPCSVALRLAVSLDFDRLCGLLDTGAVSSEELATVLELVR